MVRVVKAHPHENTLHYVICLHRKILKIKDTMILIRKKAGHHMGEWCQDFSRSLGFLLDHRGPSVPCEVGVEGPEANRRLVMIDHQQRELTMLLRRKVTELCIGKKGQLKLKKAQSAR